MSEVMGSASGGVGRRAVEEEGWAPGGGGGDEPWAAGGERGLCSAARRGFSGVDRVEDIVPLRDRGTAGMTTVLTSGPLGPGGLCAGPSSGVARRVTRRALRPGARGLVLPAGLVCRSAEPGGDLKGTR